MLSSSSRAAVSSATFAAHSLLGCHAPKVVAASASFTICSQTSLHQRRLSSSKTSSPKNRHHPKAIPARDVTASGNEAKATSASETKGSGGATRKRRANKVNDGSNCRNHADMLLSLPSVPNTQHLSQEAIGLTNFFSMHRPISITHSVPKSITDEAFAEIFSARTRADGPDEVISTISRVVDNIEGPMAKLTLSPSEDLNGDNVHKVEIRHDDGSNSSMLVHAKNVGSQFLPFQPPPLPVPASENGAPFDAATSGESLELQPQHRVYQAMFTIEETMDADGRVHVMAHSPEILQDSTTSRQSRRLRYENALRRKYELNAISVVKRRKARMKKMKLKKRRKAQRKMRERLKKL